MHLRKTRRRQLAQLLGGAVVVALAACHGGDGRPNDSAGPVSGAPSAHPAAGMTAAVGVAGALAVDLRFGLPSAPVQGTPFPVSLQLSASSPQPALRLRIRGDDGLEVQEPSEIAVERLDPGVVKSIELTLTGAAPGLHLVSVDVALDLNGGGSRSFQFPVLVAPR